MASIYQFASTTFVPPILMIFERVEDFLRSPRFGGFIDFKAET